MTSPAEFLADQLNEDARIAFAEVDAEVERLRADGMPNTTREDLLQMTESDHWRRPLLEVNAKRKALMLLAQFENLEWTGYAERDQARMVVLALLSPYADQPGFNPGWSL